MEELLKNYHSFLELPVVWGEMDAALHVNNTVYLRYSESARIDYFLKLNFTVNAGVEGDPVGPILAEVNCKYKAPLTFPDTVTVATRIRPGSVDEFSFVMEQIIVSHKLKRIAAEVSARLVSYDYRKLQKAPLTDALKALLMQKQQL